MVRILLTPEYISQLIRHTEVQKEIPEFKALAERLNNRVDKKSCCGNRNTLDAKTIEDARMFIIQLSDEKIAKIKTILNIAPTTKFKTFTRSSTTKLITIER
jgi:hypothetical protein